MKVLSFRKDPDEFRREKEADRMEDLRLIAEGVKTPQEIQELNSMIPPGAKISFDLERYLRDQWKRNPQRGS